MHMPQIRSVCSRTLLHFFLLILLTVGSQLSSRAAEPLRALLISGGCCHDYGRQKKILKEGIEARANIVVDVIYTDDRSTTARFEIYENPDWAKGYDVIIHDECSADVKDMPYVQNILNAHKTVPAVNLHCAMHCYRTGTDDWFKFIGIQSTGHGPQEPIAIQFVDTDHPITKTLGDWTTINEELYNNIKIFDTARPIARGTQIVRNKDGSERKVESVVAWINDYGDTHVFSTTIGHNNETVGDDRYLNLVTRGMLWACGKLNDDYLKKEVALIRRVNLAKDKVALASSEESGKQNFASKAFDGSTATRWCANGPGENQWLQVDLGAPTKITGTQIDWEMSDIPYHYKIEGSDDGQKWTTLVDASQNSQEGPNEDNFNTTARFLRVTFLGKPGGGWASIFEFEVFGDKTETVDPRQAKNEADQKVLADAKIPEGFDATVFAAPPMANYPVFVAAAPDGTLYVSSDGNGSLDRNPHRGRVLRLRDLDGDGRADEVKEFVPDVDSPRGLVWDHDRVYLMHPPNLSAFIDHDGDGVADEKKVLVKGIAFGFKDRPADHTSNGLSLGIDGWLYCAIGDFGFMEAEGTDGRKLQLRGGGVVRVRPDGTGLELFARGTRNILETPVSPLLDIFARDNTNDGGGWDVRFHHFTGLEEHGYPSLYKNFNDEIIQPLADYGGGSGCGAAWIDEPGIPAKWNNAPFTADWGRNWIYQHRVMPNGATFTEKQTEFFGATRVTDLDADALSNIYIASWKGATFTWAGPDVGYIVRLTPKGFTPEPLPNIDALGQDDLVKLLESPSARRRLAAQRALIRNGLNTGSVRQLTALAGNNSKPMASRVAAIFALKQGLGTDANETLGNLAADPSVAAWALRALTDREDQLAGVPDLTLVASLKSNDARTRREAVVSTARLGNSTQAISLVPLLADRDPVIAHTTVQALKRLHAVDICFAAVDTQETNSPERVGALRVLQSLHEAAVVDGLIARLNNESDAARRQGLLAALCRLYFTEGEWTGNSWGTRPDTSGPIYQPVEWNGTDAITAALKQALKSTRPDEVVFLAKEMDRNKIRMNDAVLVLVELAKNDPAQLPVAMKSLASATAIPSPAVPLLIETATATKTAPEVRADAVAGLAKLNSEAAVLAMLAALEHFDGGDSDNVQDARRAAGNAFINSPNTKLHTHSIAKAAGKLGASGVSADAALLKIADDKNASPEARAVAEQSLDKGWNNSARRVQILKAVAIVQQRSYRDKVIAAASDSDPSVADAAKSAAKALRIDLAKLKPAAGQEKTVGEMPVADVVAAILKTHGDVAIGEKLFTQQACITCHTVRADEPPRGPFLGNIATTYARPDLAENILLPNKTLAQGFVGNHFELKDGTEYDGFVTLEAADTVTIRNVASQEIAIPVKDIVKREKLERSMMPEGLAANLTVVEFASLLDYLEALAKKQ